MMGSWDRVIRLGQCVCQVEEWSQTHPEALKPQRPACHKVVVQADVDEIGESSEVSPCAQLRYQQGVVGQCPLSRSTEKVAESVGRVLEPPDETWCHLGHLVHAFDVFNEFPVRRVRRRLQQPRHIELRERAKWSEQCAA